MRSVEQSAKITPGTPAPGTEDAAAKGREIAEMRNRTSIKFLEGGAVTALLLKEDLEIEGALTKDQMEGERLVMRFVNARSNNAIIAALNKDSTKPQTNVPPILNRSFRGSSGANGSMTKFGTKNTARQRVRKRTPGPNTVFDRESATRRRRNTRSIVSALRQSNMAPKAGGNVEPRRERATAAAR